MNSFDNKLPKTTSYWKENEMFFVKHKSFHVTLEEGKAIAELLQHAFSDTTTRALIIDNREAKGVWAQDINQLWSDIEGIDTNNPKKVVTLTNSAIASMQINRISRNNNISSFSRAFFSDLTDEVYDFINS
ncbi:hypothetical protein [Vallitalea okinawensis]|uniref:hypothetical protein n=1 Tax=Vallitalea okinawensis TaxID=2078660 RepID=UPI000CFBB95E|nr:hypothetical protein [Vallitalea okinawensis]